MRYVFMASPVGALTLAEKDGALCRVGFGEIPPEGAVAGECPVLKDAITQLTQYFAGVRRAFSLPLQPEGSAFQRICWKALCDIPYGETRTYGDLARAIGKPKAVRAVGGANHVNPIAIIIPCHRVIGADGSLTGYGGGLAVKEALLRMEGSLL